MDAHADGLVAFCVQSQQDTNNHTLPPLASTCLLKRFLRFKFVAYDPVYRHPTILSAFSFIASSPALLHIPYLSTSNSPLAPLISYMFIRLQDPFMQLSPPLSH